MSFGFPCSVQIRRVLLRVRMLYYIKHEVIGDMVQQITDGVPSRYDGHSVSQSTVHSHTQIDTLTMFIQRFTRQTLYNSCARTVQTPNIVAIRKSPPTSKTQTHDYDLFTLSHSLSLSLLSINVGFKNLVYIIQFTFVCCAFDECAALHYIVVTYRSYTSHIAYTHTHTNTRSDTRVLV